MDYGSATVELFAAFIILYLITKTLGKTQISQVTPFDFISALVLGEIVGAGIFDTKITVWHMIYTVALWGTLIYLTEFLSIKFLRTRKIFQGEPSILIRKGKIQKDILKKNKLDLNQLQHLLRSKDVFSIREVEYAILETNGEVNVLKRAPFEKPTLKDMNLPFSTVALPMALIIDGAVIGDNLKQINRDGAWLKDQLAAYSITEYKDVLFAEYKEGEGLYVDKQE